MIKKESLPDLFRRCEAANIPVRTFFDDGSCYDLRILSTMHIDEAGDVAADVVSSVKSPNPDLWKNSAMNFLLKDVVRVETNDECLYMR